MSTWNLKDKQRVEDGECRVAIASELPSAIWGGCQNEGPFLGTLNNLQVNCLVRFGVVVKMRVPFWAP